MTYTCGNPPTRRQLYQNGREPGFLTNFTQEELTRIRPVTQKTILTECDYDFLKNQSGAQIGGTAYLPAIVANYDTWPKTVAQAVEGYGDAYYEYATDTVFLMDVQQLKNVQDNGGVLGGNYCYRYGTYDPYHGDYKTGFTSWLRTAGGRDGFSTRVMSIDPTSGSISRSHASYVSTMARPAFYLNEMPAPEPEVTPTPDVSPTPTVTPTPDSTETPTVTPTPDPTETPTATPTAAPSVTPTPDPSAPSTPDPSATPTPTPTPTPPPAPAPDDDDDDDDDYYRPPAKTPSKSTPTPKPAQTPSPTPAPTPEPAPAPVRVEQFSDVPEDAWYYEPVKYVLDRGLMVGMNSTQFAPEAEITRAMFVTVLYRMAGEPELPDGALGEPFGDVKGGSWYEKAVYWARQSGIVNGYSAGEYAPHRGITREQMAVIAYRYAQWKQSGTQTGGSLSYTDQNGISEYARDAVAWSAANGIMQGYQDNTFNPQANTTRAQAAAIFERLQKNTE